ncbi:ParB family protein [Pseudomonas sp. DWP3-1-2]|uniref:ParB family protein n=1 Tax=Pseudomonas sp. DWP3-1-2 TaxID=2804645 RepID=UPI003CF0FC44
MAAKSPDAETIKSKLLQGSFMNNGPVMSQLSDPVADTPMVITLDKLRPYEHNPRINRNPLFDELKASIKSRGLDAPPPITRKPGEEHFIIRNGGNTRLAILNELWTETRDEQFFRIHCLFRPWPKRGDIVALTGHLAENDMHGELTFIERALGIDRAKEFYELEAGQPVSQRELARLLGADGYPVSQSHISKMQDAVQFLLPAIPALLFAGMGKPQIERLISLRRSAGKTWQQHTRDTDIDFSMFFTDILNCFDGKPDFSFERFQDELIHQMQEPLGKDYNWLKLDMLETKGTDKASPAKELPPAPTKATVTAPSSGLPGERLAESSTNDSKLTVPHEPEPDPLQQSDHTSDREPLSDEDQQALIQSHIITPIAGLTPRTQAMKRQLAQATGEPIPDFEEACLQAIPVQVGGLHPVSDLWYIERQIDEPAELRQQIFGLASEVAEEVQAPDILRPSEWGIGFSLDPDATVEIVQGSVTTATIKLLESLSGSFSDTKASQLVLSGDLGQLMLGCSRQQSQAASANDRLSDQALVKVFRVMRLARRLIELEASA